MSLPTDATTGAHAADEHSDTDSPSPPVELAAARTPTAAPAAAPWAIPGSRMIRAAVSASEDLVSVELVGLRCAEHAAGISD